MTQFRRNAPPISRIQIENQHLKFTAVCNRKQMCGI